MIKTARHRLTNKNLLSTIAILYRAVRECLALGKVGWFYTGIEEYVDVTFGVDADELQVHGIYLIGKARAYARADDSATLLCVQRLSIRINQLNR